MASFLLNFTKYFVIQREFLHQEFFVRVIIWVYHWALSELYWWLVWLFSAFLLSKIAPLYFGSLEIFQMMEKIYRFLFYPHSILQSYTISSRQSNQIATKEVHRAPDCIFTSYILYPAVCYLFLIMREQFNETEMISFIFLFRTND